MLGDITIVSSLPELPSEQAPAQFKGTFTQYLLDIKYTWDEHKMQMPVAAAPLQSGGGSSIGQRTPCEVIQLAAPSGRKVVKWTAERADDWPLCPDKDTRDSNDVFLRAEITGAAKDLLPNMKDYVHRVTGIYWYALKRPVGPGDALAFGAVPAFKANVRDGVMPASRFVQDIITNPAGSGGGAIMDGSGAGQDK